jgi:hypothetical protein
MGLLIALAGVAPAASATVGTSGRKAVETDSSVSAATSMRCWDTVIIGARGSGQTDALGDEVRSLTDKIMGQVKPQRPSLLRLGVIYPAESTDLLKPPQPILPSNPVWQAAYAKRVARYFAGVDNGIATLHEMLTTRAASCPNEILVLAGYSQGAMVVHRELVRLAASGRQEILRRVAGTGLIADPDRQKYSIALRYGTAPWSGHGIDTTVNGYLQDVPAGMVASRAFSLCDKGDVVCDFRWSQLLYFAAGAKVHASYVNDAQMFPISDAIAGNVMAFAVPKPATYTLTGTVGQPFAAQLTASTGNGITPTWRVAAASVLPAGLTLATNGTISGTPAQAGTYQSTVQVKGRLNLWLPAVVRVTILGDVSEYLTAYQGLLYQHWIVGVFDTRDARATGLPPGLALHPRGLLHGVPSAPGSYAVTVTMTIDGVTQVKSLDLTVGSAPADVASKIEGRLGMVTEGPGDPSPTVRQLRRSPSGRYTAAMLGIYEVVVVYDSVSDVLYPLTTGVDRSGIGLGGAPANLSWSPDEKYLAFTSTEPLTGPTANGPWYNIYLWSTTTHQIQAVTTGSTAGESDNPVWSPDGTKLAFNSREIHVLNDADRVQVWDRATGATSTLPCPADAFGCRFVASSTPGVAEPWTPDSERLVYVGYGSSTYYVNSVHVWTTQGSSTELAAGVSGARLSPDGVSVFVSGAFGISILDVASGQPLRQFSQSQVRGGVETNDMVSPTPVSPDGRYLSFWSCGVYPCSWAILDVEAGTIYHTSVGGGFLGWDGSAAVSQQYPYAVTRVDAVTHAVQSSQCPSSAVSLAAPGVYLNRVVGRMAYVERWTF